MRAVIALLVDLFQAGESFSVARDRKAGPTRLSAHLLKRKVGQVVVVVVLFAKHKGLLRLKLDGLHGLLDCLFLSELL